MNRVLVIGCPGAGKSTFSRKLAHKTSLPLVHLDSYYHQDLWDADEDVKREQWRAKVTEMIAAERWIIDGNYGGSFDIRFPAADTIVFLDYPRWLSLWRVFCRRLEFARKKRPDMPDGWKEKIGWDFLQFIWRYRSNSRPRVLAKLDEYAGRCVVYVFKTPKDADSLLASL